MKKVLRTFFIHHDTCDARRIRACARHAGARWV